MKTMKKSKVIVPALGLLLLSTAASITGTVAWFTANKEITATAGNFAVASTTGDLELTAAPGIGTALATTGSADEKLRNIVPIANNVLADASYNHKTDTVYKPINNATAVEAHTQPAASASGDNYLRQTVNGVKKHSAFTWTYTFKFTPEADGVQIGLFFDKANSSVKDQDTANGSNSFKGFRLAFIAGDTAATKTVWAANRGSSECKYVASTDNMAGTAYAAADYDLVDKDNTEAAPADNVKTEAQCQAMATFLGSFGTTRDTEGKVSLTVRCVAWFEGTDADVRNEARGTDGSLDSVLATMKFKAVNFKANA